MRLIAMACQRNLHLSDRKYIISGKKMKYNVFDTVDMYINSKFANRIIDIGSIPESAPSEMISFFPEGRHAAMWHPVDSPIDDELVAIFERALQLLLPPQFKLFLLYKCLLNSEMLEGALYEINPDRPIGWLEWSLMWSKRLFSEYNHFLVPFVRGVASSSVLCFDTRNGDASGDYPVVAIRSAAIGLRRDICLKQFYSFSSFSEYINYLGFWLKYNEEIAINNIECNYCEYLQANKISKPPAFYYKGIEFSENNDGCIVANIPE